MKKITLIFFVFSLSTALLLACSNKNKKSATQEPEERVLVWNDFIPTIQVTDYIRTTSLDVLIRRNEGKISIKDSELLKTLPRYVDFGNEVCEGDYFTLNETLLVRYENRVLVSRATHLTLSKENATSFNENDIMPKVFYLEDKVGFYLLNKNYVDNIESLLSGEILP